MLRGTIRFSIRRERQIVQTRHPASLRALRLCFRICLRSSTAALREVALFACLDDSRRRFLGAAVLLRTQLALFVLWVLVAEEIDVLHNLRARLLVRLDFVIKVVVEEAEAERALLEVVVVGARLAVRVLPELPQVLIRGVDLILELTIAVSSGFREGGSGLHDVAGSLGAGFGALRRIGVLQRRYPLLVDSDLPAALGFVVDEDWRLFGRKCQ